MKYRRDIDGLRAVAVLSVILSHAGFSPFTGGFIGVDVFFVISGFLITRILITEMGNGSYSLAKFYERRARRILPALIFVIFVTIPFAWYLMLPNFFRNFGQSVAATLLFSNNLLLAKTSGYWALESNFKPFLHTWSLGVEEQFYIVFPLLLALVWRFGRTWQLAMIALLGVVSFALAEHGWRTDPAVSFYLPTTRAWELMVGCAAAYVEQRPRRFDNVASLAGLAGIVAAVLLFTEHTPTPSLYVALPVFGSAAVLLFSRPGTIAYRILSLAPFVGIGLISYSAYLWHQPLFAIARVALLDPPSQGLMVALSLVSLALGWFSWKFVEQPFRNPKIMPLKVFAPPAVALSTCLIAFGLVLNFQQGFPRRTFPNISEAGDVYIGYNERVYKYKVASFPDNNRPNVLVLGNSFGRDVANVLIESGILEKNNLAYMSVAPDEFWQKDKQAEMAPLLRQANVVVAAVQIGEAERIYEGLQRVKTLTNATLLVFGPKHFGNNLNPFGRVPMEDRQRTRSRVPSDVIQLNQELRTLLKQEEYVDMLELLGDDGRTVAIFDENGNPLSQDRIHLTKYGAEFAAERLLSKRPEVDQMLVGQLADRQDHATPVARNP